MQAIGFVYNVIDSVAGTWTKQIAVKNYIDSGHSDQYGFERTTSVVQVVTAPSKPSLTATASGYTSIDVRGVTADDGGAAVDRWELKRATSEAGIATAGWTHVTGASGNSFELSVSNLQAGTAYFFQTRARNSEGYSTASDIESTSTNPYTAPATPSLTVTSSNSEVALTLAASVSSNGGRAITAWSYKRASSSAGLASASWQAVTGASGNSMSLTLTDDDGLIHNTEYWFTVRATNSAGDSDQAPARSGTTLFVPELPSTSDIVGGSDRDHSDADGKRVEQRRRGD